MRISDWSSDVCSSDLTSSVFCVRSKPSRVRRKFNLAFCAGLNEPLFQPAFIPHITASCLSAAFSALSSFCLGVQIRSEEHTSELQSLMRISYAVFCLKKKIYIKNIQYLLTLS